MTTPGIIICTLSAASLAACIITYLFAVAERVESEIDAAWWRRRDPNWIHPLLSPGASPQTQGCSDTKSTRAEFPQHFSAPTGTSHPAQTQPKGISSQPKRTPGELISALSRSGALRRVE